MAGKQSKRNNKRNGKQQQRSRKNPPGSHGGPIPSLWRASFHFPAYNTLSAAAGLNATYGYRLNGMFDPDFTGTGIQPAFFDQFATMYSKYRVINATVEISMCNNTSSAVYFVFLATTRNSGAASLVADAGNRYSHTGVLAPTGGNVYKFKRKYSIGSFWGSGVQEDDFAALTSGNPNNVVYFWINIAGMNVSAPSVSYSINIRYDADFHMPSFVNSS